MLVDIIWDLDDDPDGNVQHIAQHGLDKDDVAHAMNHVTDATVSHRSGFPIAFGPACDGREIVVIYEEIDDTHIYPLTAYPRESRR